MSTTLDASFLRAVLMQVSFKPDEMKRAQAALLLIALERGTVMATQIPREIVGDSEHRAGAACGALVSQNLLKVTARVKSPDEKAKGRKLNVYRVPYGRRRAVVAWLRANKFEANVKEDMPLFQQAT